MHLVISLAPGGLERLVVDWTNTRNQLHPHSTQICCLDEPGALSNQIRPETPLSCLSARRTRWPWDHSAVKELRTLLTQPAPVVLHAHNLAAWQYGVLAKVFGPRRAPHPNPLPIGAREKITLIYTQHGTNVHNLSLRNRLRARLLACFTNHIVAVSAATADAMASKLWIPRSRIRVIANGVKEKAPPSPSKERTSNSATFNFELSTLNATAPHSFSARLCIGTVGRLAQVKGIDRLLHAIHLSNNQQPTTHNCAVPGAPPALLLIGDGPERTVLQTLAHTLGIADQVVFMGYQPDPTPFLAKMDLFILPSRSEGMSVALLEAMAAGVPVAATDVGANREILDDGKCGLLLPDDESQWLNMITSALHDHTATATKVKAAQQRVKTHYSLTATLTSYEQLYQ